MSGPIDGITFARCPGPCGRWRVRVHLGERRGWHVRRHRGCGLQPLPASHEVRDVAPNPPGSTTGSAR
jgi:hypothetical protein